MAAVIDRIPPHNDDAEKAVLGAMLIDYSAVAVVMQRLRADDFYSTANRSIFEAILNLDSGGHKADLLTIKDELEKTGRLDQSGGIDYIASLTNVVPSSANTDYYAQIVQDCSLRRGLIQAAGIAGNRAYDETNAPRHILEEFQQRLFKLSDTRRLFSYQSAKETIKTTFEYLTDVFKKGEFSGIRSGFDALDNYTSGFQRNEFTVIGARPGMGKTALALNIASNIALKQKIPTAFFSLEMSDRALLLRLISSEAEINSKRFRDGFLTQKDFSNMFVIADKIDPAPLFFVDMPHMTILDIQAMSRMLRIQEKVEIIFIDYIGLISSDNPQQPRYNFFSDVSRSLKGLARELDIPIVALSQVGRELEKEKRMPTLADIRESGSIEQDADMVILIDKDRELDKTQEEQAKSNEQKVRLIVAKNRNGPTGIVDLTYLKSFTKFVPYTGQKESK
ncbi:MAG: replicative DNA helicase [Treponema sp.]|jgi:replicative DNA helicase|nr:replicative DNA helicase [Treponema sp.]